MHLYVNRLLYVQTFTLKPFWDTSIISHTQHARVGTSKQLKASFPRQVITKLTYFHLALFIAKSFKKYEYFIYSVLSLYVPLKLITNFIAKQKPIFAIQKFHALISGILKKALNLQSLLTLRPNVVICWLT